MSNELKVLKYLLTGAAIIGICTVVGSAVFGVIALSIITKGYAIALIPETLAFAGSAAKMGAIIGAFMGTGGCLLQVADKFSPSRRRHQKVMNFTPYADRVLD